MCECCPRSLRSIFVWKLWKELFGSQNVDVGRERNVQDIHAQIGLQRGTQKKLLYSSSFLKKYNQIPFPFRTSIDTHTKFQKITVLANHWKKFPRDVHKETRQERKRKHTDRFNCFWCCCLNYTRAVSAICLYMVLKCSQMNFVV